ncbi:MAG: CPBP family intramembrane glutamic endopeptidase, partial [Deltaproteobacteria bacterium]
PVLAVAAYVVLLFAAPILVSLAAAASRAHGPMLDRGGFILSLMLVQHGMLVAAAFWFLGAIASRDRRESLGLVAVTPIEVARAVGLAFALIAVAVVTTHFIKDVSVTPMGQLVERVPVRFAIAFGALLAPFSEELFFRGVLYGAFAKRWAWLGVVASVLIFTASHALQLSGAAIGLIPIASVAVVNGVLRARTGGITQPWIVHTVYNFTLSLGLYFG